MPGPQSHSLAETVKRLHGQWSSDSPQCRASACPSWVIFETPPAAALQGRALQASGLQTKRADKQWRTEHPHPLQRYSCNTFSSPPEAPRRMKLRTECACWKTAIAFSMAQYALHGSASSTARTGGSQHDEQQTAAGSLPALSPCQCATRRVLLAWKLDRSSATLELPRLGNSVVLPRSQGPEMLAATLSGHPRA